MAGEFDLIEWIRQQQKVSPLVKVGVGDDLAVLTWPLEELLLVGVDQAIDGVHFDSAVHSPEQIGRKVMNRNLSDCAAMSCLPAAAVVAVALPASYSLENAKELYAGIAQAGDAYGCPIVGGDTATWPGKLVISVTVLGGTGSLKPVGRKGAKPGDSIYVTGALGGSLLGRHMDFVPRIAQGRELAGIASAMIDVSDGISRDLQHICKASGVGAVIEEDRLPIHPDAVKLSQQDGKPALEHALHDGEDYELLYTSSRPEAPGILIGRIVAEPGMWLEKDGSRRVLSQRGWQHSLA
jgi:thiamine-monophosphate kinase